jgi:hypothetical protein
MQTIFFSQVSPFVKYLQFFSHVSPLVSLTLDMIIPKAFFNIQSLATLIRSHSFTWLTCTMRFFQIKIKMEFDFDLELRQAHQVRQARFDLENGKRPT